MHVHWVLGFAMSFRIAAKDKKGFPVRFNDDIRIAVAGLGAIGRSVADRINRGLPGLRLTAVAARDLNRATDTVSAFRDSVAVVSTERLSDFADVIIDCASSGAFCSIAVPAIEASRLLITVNAGALLSHPELEDRAKATGAKIIVPTGALLGFDAVRAAAEGTINSVRMISRKPPRGLAGAPYLEKRNIDVVTITEPLKVFDGTAREAIIGFPENVNVAAALSLAGIGPDRTMIEVWADPTISRNVHSVSVVSDAAEFNMAIANVPSENPKTGKITALSVISTLRRFTATVCVGA